MRERSTLLASPRTGRSLRAATVALMLALTSCSALHRHLFGGSTPGRAGTVTISPPSGKAGTAFSLNAGGFRPGEKLTFEIDTPNHQRFVGPSHAAAADGHAAGAYTPQATDPPGTYQVKATGDRGTHATGSLVITP